MCLDNSSSLFKMWHRVFPVGRMNGYKVLQRTYAENKLVSPVYSDYDNPQEWIEMRINNSDGHGFYFFKDYQGARNYANHLGSSRLDVYSVIGYNVIEKGIQDGHVAYICKQMELISDAPVTVFVDKNKQLEDALEALDKI